MVCILFGEKSNFFLSITNVTVTVCLVFYKVIWPFSNLVNDAKGVGDALIPVLAPRVHR